jgi:hypothetical protein
VIIVKHSAVVARRLAYSSDAHRRLRISTLQQHARKVHVATKAASALKHIFKKKPVVLAVRHCSRRTESVETWRSIAATAVATQRTSLRKVANQLVLNQVSRRSRVQDDAIAACCYKQCCCMQPSIALQLLRSVLFEQLW